MTIYHTKLLLSTVLILGALTEINCFQPLPRTLGIPKLAAAKLDVDGDKSKALSGSSDESTNYNYIGFNTDQNTPYVPSGMSPEQYAQIKKTEAAKAASMDFGAWGPRFKQTAAPGGDWMVNTNLWVKGFQQQRDVALLSQDDVERQETRQRQWNAVKSTLPSLFLAYLMVDILLISLASVRSTQQVVWSVLLAQQGILQAARQHTTVVFGKLHVLVLKLSLTAVATPFLHKYRDIANRRWLWSPRKIVATPLLAAGAMLVLKMALIVGIKAVLQ
ncbi:expressed unknown protein [Seminavis robusta]|uniref:Uncharacterized protein n=1 Tax=Seminavis robusta TaxID=568900 RepID=A0A9N8HWJ1_9STRA|nr:expressed unknown protein [Seminavis robusta]|eukprot:Sro2229_g319910.1 n/a (275) ;mRNA; r:1396-2220